MYPPGGTRPFGLCGETVFATAAGAAGGLIYGVPVYSPFLRVNTLVNGQTVEEC